MQTQTPGWTHLGPVEDLKRELESLGGLKEIEIEGRKLVLSFYENEFGVLDNKCNHQGGPLSKGRMKKGCIECPWHYWHFNHKTGEGQLTSENRNYVANAGRNPSYPVKTENGELYVDMTHRTERVKAEFASKSNLAREVKREPGGIRVLGLSTTAMDTEHPRYSTSEDLLVSALDRASTEKNVETRVIKLAELKIRNCEGFYSKSEKACSWPCSITKMDPTDQMAQVYEALVHWADVVIVATPLRWGAASSLYYKIAERLNSVQNRITVENKVLIQNKTAGFIITGGQDNVQSVAGQMLNFFGELGFAMPPFPFVGHSLGWSAEKMEENARYVQRNQELHEAAFEVVGRSIDLASKLLATESAAQPAPKAT